MTNLELLKLLMDKKIADSFQFFTSCQYKLAMAELNYRALKNLIEQYQSAETEFINKVYEDVKKTGKGKYKAHKNSVDFYGIEIDTTTAIEKVFMEMMGLLHNFFDTFAQWINSSLFGEKALQIKKVSLVSVIRELPHFPEYTGQFISDFNNITSNDYYIYVSDFNNTQKHRYQLYVQNKFDLLAVQGDVSAPVFAKDGRVHIKKNALNIVLESLNYCTKLLTDSQTYVEKYYGNNDCNYVEHRIYNPKTYLFFENEDDFKHLRNPKNHYHYIEVDSSNIFTEYQIMLVSDCTSAENEEDKSIEMYNSTYPIIMLTDYNGSNIIGILKPDDDEVYSFGDEHNLIYRKYKSYTTDYQPEMFSAIGEGGFKTYPYLSEISAAYEIADTNE